MGELQPRPGGYPIKLVRDNTQYLVNPSGTPGELWYAPAPRADVLPALQQKLGEEVTEYLLAAAQGDGGAELLDVYAAVVALAGHHGMPDMAERLATSPRGGFFEAS